MTQAAAAGTYEERHSLGRWRAALSGFLAVAVMLGVSELVAALLPGARSHVVAVGDQVIDHTPGWVERAVIANLGTSDKPFLIANVLVFSGLLGAVLGLLAARRFVLGAAGIAFMAGVGTAASFADPQTDGAAPLWVGIVSAAAGIATLWLLLRPAPEAESTVGDPTTELSLSLIPMLSRLSRSAVSERAELGSPSWMNLFRVDAPGVATAQGRCAAVLRSELLPPGARQSRNRLGARPAFHAG